MWILCAMLLTLLSGASLFFSWKYLSPPHKAKYVYSAWFGLFVALYCWSQAIGMEYALIYGWLIFAFIVLLIILYNQERRTKNNKLIANNPLSFPSLAISLKQLALVFLIIPMCGWVSLSSVVMLARYLPVPPENSIVFSMLTIPIVWALLVYMTCFKQRLWEDFLRLSMVSLLTTLLIYV